MSTIKQEITEKINSSSKIENQKNKYKYTFSNNNISKKSYPTKNQKKIYIPKVNIRPVKSKSPSKINLETTYSINKSTSTYYVNGLNNKESNINKQRSPDIRFYPHGKIENEDNKNINKENINYTINRNNKRYQQYFSDEDLATQIETNIKKITKYTSPKTKNQNQKFFENKSKCINNIEENNNIKNRNSNIRSSYYYTKNKNNNNSITLMRPNYNFKNINECSNEQYNINKYDYSQYSPNNKKYKCDIKIHNINISPKKRKTFSYDKVINNNKIRNSNGTKIFISDHSKAYDNFELEHEFRKIKSFDGKKLQMQNSQNMQILQEETLYQILVPTYEIQHENKFQIWAKNNDKNNTTDIKKTEISENEINKKIIKTEEKINKTIKIFKKQIWAKTNSPNRIKKTVNKNIIKNKKFEGEMIIERTDLNYERIPRNWNSQLEQKSEKPFSIEREKKEKILEEKSVEKLFYEGNNLNSIKIKNQNLLKENKEYIEIKGEHKTWENNIRIQKDENKIEIKSNININKKEINRKVKYKIEKEEKNEDSVQSSESDILKKIQPYNEQNNYKYEECIKKSFYSNGSDRKVIINNISNNYPKKIDTYWGSNEKKIINKSVYLKKTIKTSMQKDNNINLEYPSTKIAVNPKYVEQEEEMDENNHSKGYYYRESLIKKIKPKLENGQNDNKELNNNDEPMDTNENKTNNDEDSQSYDISTPSSKIKSLYMEEIIIVSPKSKTKEKIDENDDKENLSQSGINVMEEEYQNYMNLEEKQKHISELKDSQEEKQIIQSVININDNNNNINNNKNNNINKNINNDEESDFDVNDQEEEKSNLTITDENIQNIKIDKRQIFQNSDVINDININKEPNNSKKAKKKENAKKIQISKSQDLCDPLNQSNGLYKPEHKIISSKTVKISFGNKDISNMGNVVLNNTLKRKKNNVKIKKKENNEEKKNEEDILIIQTNNKKGKLNQDEANNNINDGQYKSKTSKTNKVRILKK